MSKPMLVTLPIVFLLLDRWPLGRVSLELADFRARAPRLLLEKLPMFPMSSGTIAEGESRVEVWDLAVGGDGESPFSGFGEPRHGGDASSTAIAQSDGVAESIANALAIGGNGGGEEIDGRGGASSFAQALGGGISRARSMSQAGGATFGPRGPVSEDAIARAVAEAVAEGLTRWTHDFATHQTFAMAHATLESEVRAEARAGLAASDALASTADAASFVTGAHDRMGEWGRIGFHLDTDQIGPDIILRSEGEAGTRSTASS